MLDDISCKKIELWKTITIALEKSELAPQLFN